jgi:hypothetical protein
MLFLVIRFNVSIVFTHICGGSLQCEFSVGVASKAIIDVTGGYDFTAFAECQTLKSEQRCALERRAII